MSDYEMSDEELMIIKLEELQKENDRLRANQQTIEPLLQTIRQQEQKITQQNSLLIEERKQNESLLELAKKEKKLNELNRNLQSKITELENSLKLKNTQLQKLSSEVSSLEDKFSNLPSKAQVNDFNQSFGKAIRVMDSLRWYHVVNWGVVVVFSAVVIFNFIGLWMLRSTAKDTLQTTTAISRGIYAPEGYSVLQGSESNIEYIKQQQGR